MLNALVCMEYKCDPKITKRFCAFAGAVPAAAAAAEDQKMIQIFIM